MTAKECITSIPGFRFVFEQLEILSSPGRKAARQLPFMTEAAEISARLGKVGRAVQLLHESRPIADNICLKLMQIKDVGGTASRIAVGDLDGQPLDDVELFEAKCFALLANDIRGMLKQVDATALAVLPDLSGVITLLDPEGHRVPSFHVYDAYDERLAPLRREIRQRHTLHPDNPDTDALLAECEEIEAQVRRRLSARLQEHSGAAMSMAVAAVADLDVLIASAKLVDTLRLTPPSITDTVTRYEGLVNPAVQHALQEERKRFQPIDITVWRTTTLITGSNMAGKSVALKTVALAQTMAQLGLYVPARQAEVVPVQTIMLSMGDGQSEMNGLSSYGAEMLRIDKILKALGEGVNGLVLIDEPARTTNPDEGRAIVNALVALLGKYRVPALVTTHYSGIVTAGRHLRVRGFSSKAEGGQVTMATLNDFMDYSLYETDGSDVPHEAVRIARILGVSSELLEKTEDYLSS